MYKNNNSNIHGDYRTYRKYKTGLRKTMITLRQYECGGIRRSFIKTYGYDP